jgi:uncharacterized membrane protein YeaQ/YmgE (transglycosylase-associated protein family)
MDSHHLIAWLLIGLIAGALAGRVVEGSGFGILGDIVVGLVGAFAGGLILNAVTTGGDASNSFVVECVVAFVGAVVLLTLLRLVTGGGRGRGRRGLARSFRR